MPPLKSPPIGDIENLTNDDITDDDVDHVALKKQELMTYSIHEILSLTITPTLTQTLLNIVYIYMRCYRNRMYICLSNPDTSHKKVTVAMASASGRVHVRQLTQDEEKEVSLTLTLTLLNPNPNRNPKLKPRRFLETPTLTPTATPTLTSNLNFNPNSNFSCKL